MTKREQDRSKVALMIAASTTELHKRSKFKFYPFLILEVRQLINIQGNIIEDWPILKKILTSVKMVIYDKIVHFFIRWLTDQEISRESQFQKVDHKSWTKDTANLFNFKIIFIYSWLVIKCIRKVWWNRDHNIDSNTK